MSPDLTSAPMRTMPSAPRFRSFSSLTLGMSRVITSGPNLVSRTSTKKSSTCTEVYILSLTTRSDTTMASSKLPPYHGMKATNTFCPNATSPCSVAEPSASKSPFFTSCPLSTNGLCVMAVEWLLRWNCCRRWISFSSPLPATTICCASTSVTSPSSPLTIVCPESLAARASKPVPTNGARGTTDGTACRCMFEPINALWASSCSIKGINPAAMLTICAVETSI